MMHSNRRWLFVPGLALLLACSGGGAGRKLDVGQEPDTTGGGAGFRSNGGQVGDGGVASGDNALSVRVEDIDEMTVEVITLACAGDCADVEAVAHGGIPPYTFAWEDGSDTPKRHVCLDANQQLTVSATDTSIVDAEFDYEAQTATAEVSATVLDCTTDGGSPSDPSCFVKNQSFEGVAGVGLGDLGAALPEWKVCAATPDVNPCFATLPPTDGSTYLGAVANANEANFSESTGGAFCTPLQAGQPVSFSVDIAMSSYIGGPGAVEIWGGATSCSKDELLWTSPTITAIDEWQTLCGTLTASKSFPFLVLWPVAHNGVGGGAYLLMDNFRPAASCK